MNDNIGKGTEFENICLSTLKRLGFEELQLTKRVNDQGADWVGSFEGTRYLFQCKKHKKKQGNRAIQEAIAAKTYYKASRCAVISESGYTKSAYQLARPNYCLLLMPLEITEAVNSQKTFAELIKNYTFPVNSPIEHDYDLIKRYEQIKAQIGHTPRNKDLDPTTRYRIKKKYGSLSSLIRQLSDSPFTRRPSNEEIRKEYKRVKQAIGKTPTLANMQKQSNFSRNCFSSYPFTKLQEECGDAPNIQRGVSKEDLISAFDRLRRELGRIPSIKDLDEKGVYRSSYYRTRWGNIDTFLKDLGIPQREFKQRQYDERELILIYLLLKKAFEIRNDDDSLTLNHTVLENLKYKGKVFVSPGIFSSRFGAGENS
ncbi:MAG: homing endonuclease associated repeat-containing protein [Candidatus Loosdrechtia sp.]|uniref:homing endonuclease associated repeat-containing protein n=1 Tax=Candidatus Loosdrechtia sp. TaxID=3101272 RepID=UPI003A7728FC|nr:MAG: restriction endonuclease [Candidatus Jettenia sp. AMX2]